METILDPYGYLNVAAQNIGKLTVKIFDTQGHFAKKLCKDIIAGVQKLDIVGDLTNGSYVINAFSGETFLKAFKFIKR